jgi:hypothetical protein
MSDHQADNPYAAPAAFQQDGAAVAHGLGGRRQVDVAKRNIVGMVLTAVALGVFEFAHVAFSRIYRDFKLKLPLMTELLENDRLVYGVPALPLATFLAGLCAKTKRRSAAIGTFGLIGLTAASLYAVVALFLPLITVIDNLGP